MEFLFYMLFCVWELGAIANLSFSQSLNQGEKQLLTGGGSKVKDLRCRNKKTWLLQLFLPGFFAWDSLVG